MEALSSLLNILGGLGVFLFGMRLLSEGLHKIAGAKFQKVLNTLTTNRIAGLLTGLSVTCLIQSSSATTVMLVSLVNAGLVNLAQSIGVIMGANIGTTFTGWIVAILGFKVKITTFALPAIAISTPLLFFRSQRARDYGETLLGFGLLFLGLHLMNANVPDIKGNPEVLAFLQNFTTGGFGTIILFVIVGTFLTIFGVF